MKRVLTLTTAISVALAGIPPVPLWAQDQGAAQVQCPPDQPDCTPAEQKPRKPRKPAAQGQQEGQQAPKGQGQQGQGKPAKPGAAAADQQGQQGQGKPGKPAKPAEKPVDDGAKRPVNPAFQKPAVEEPPAKPRAGKPQTAKPQTAKPQAPEPQARPAKPQKPQRPAGKPAQQQPAAPPPAQPQQGQPTEPAPRQPKPQTEQRPDPQQIFQKPPAPDADTAISDILTGDQQRQAGRQQGQQRPRVPRDVAPQHRPQAAIDAERAAAQPVQAQRQVRRQRVSEDDIRRPHEDFRNPLQPQSEPGEPQQARKKDRGLSDLEKAGLVVLGALAVGALLKNGNRVVSNTGDRVVVDQGNGQYVVMKDDDTLLRQPGSEVETETFADGSIRTTVYRADGSRVVTVRDAVGRVLQRVAIDRYGNQTLLIDDLGHQRPPVDLDRLPRPAPEDLRISTRAADAELRAAMLSRQAARVGESFSLQQIRDYPQVRALAPTIDVENVTFETGSAAIRASEAQSLSDLGAFMAQMIKDNPAEMFLIEGHTDAVGDAAYNLALSDRRAESLALALTEYFDVPPENMVVQGYGESELLVPTYGAEPQNRRTTVRMISPLMQQLAQGN